MFSNRTAGIGLLTTLCLLHFQTTARAGLITPQERNQIPAILSFDYAAGALGLGYGIDPSSPLQVVNGSITDSGFNWTASGTYLGQTFMWSAVGIYDSASNSLHWSGDGSYAGGTWTLSGDIFWQSDTIFFVSHQTFIQDASGVNSDVTDGMDMGEVTTPSFRSDGSELDVEIKESTHRLAGFLWKVMERDPKDGWKVKVTGGVITENTFEIRERSAGGGVTVNGVGGTINLGDGTFRKTTKIDPVPEIDPSSLASALTLLTGGLAVLTGRRRPRLAWFPGFRADRP